MKIFLLAGLAAGLTLAAAAQEPQFKPVYPPPPQPVLVPPQAPPVYQSPEITAVPPAAMPPQAAYVYDQRPLAAQPPLVTGEQAQAIVDQFRSNYAKLGSPRILIYVNRELVDQRSGMKLSGRSEKVDTTRTETTAGTNSTDNKATTTTHVAAQNNYHDNGQPAPTLADRQTVRDVERLMGRPLRLAGVTLVDQGVAAQLIGDRSIGSLTLENEQARKDREAVNQIADVVVEVLISSRNVTVNEVSGPRNYSAPDILVTAIRLKDAKVVGQASATDVMNRAGGPASAARNYSVQDITEGTALALMQDMMVETK